MYHKKPRSRPTTPLKPLPARFKSMEEYEAFMRGRPRASRVYGTMLRLGEFTLNKLTDACMMEDQTPKKRREDYKSTLTQRVRAMEDANYLTRVAKINYFDRTGGSELIFRATKPRIAGSFKQ